MEQHPIPRQITTFEFKLIGFMTLRQFLYLLVTFPIAYIVFALFPIPLVNIVLAVLVAVVGILFAFVPIQDRPLETWIRNLLKRLQSPTQYFYHKHNEPLYFLKDLYFLADPHHMLAHIESKEKLAQYLTTTRQRKRPNVRKQQIGQVLAQPTRELQTDTLPYQASANTGQSGTVGGAVGDGRQSGSSLTAPVVGGAGAAAGATVGSAGLAAGAATAAAAGAASTAASGPVSWAMAGPSTGANPGLGAQGTNNAPSTKTDAGTSVTETAPASLTRSFAEIDQQHATPLKAEVLNPSPAPVMSAEVVPPTPTPTSPTAIPAPSTATGSTPTATPAPAPPPTTTGAPTPAPVAAPAPQPPVATVVQPQEPFLTGVIKTAKRIPLPGVMVYLKDGSETALRMMKTNPHGVFATFNPLPPGTYRLEIKDPNGTYFFDTMNLSIKETNTVPVEIISKEIL